MTPTALAASAQLSIRALTRDDLDDVVALDAALEGHVRRAYFQRRLASAIAQPGQHLQLAAVDAQGLAGHLLARRTSGEFGRASPGLRLEVIGVRSDLRGQGVGTQLLQALIGHGQRHGVAELRTTTAWTDHRMLRWLAAMDFKLAPDHIVECVVGDGYQAERGDALDQPPPERGTDANDYGAEADNDFEQVERHRADVTAMRPDDLAQIERIDRAITGRDRSSYIADKLGEAMADSAIRVSLSARVDDAIVGYLMARVDLGDFGRVEPVAVLDTLGVDPAYEHRGIGHALLSQLFTNLSALQIDRIETVVAVRNLALTGFLLGAGFKPSQRLTLLRSLK